MSRRRGHPRRSRAARRRGFRARTEASTNADGAAVLRSATRPTWCGGCLLNEHAGVDARRESSGAAVAAGAEERVVVVDGHVDLLVRVDSDKS